MQLTTAKREREREKKKKEKREKRKETMLTRSDDRAQKHYRAAKQYMSYGDTLKSKAHMKRALYYFGTADKACDLMAEIDSADTRGGVEKIIDLLTRTRACIRDTVVTEDPHNERKMLAVKDLNRNKSSYTKQAIEAFKAGAKVRVGDSSAYIKAPRRLYALGQNGALTNESIGPNFVDPDHAILKCEFAFAETIQDTRKMHERVLLEANKPEFVIKVLEANRDAADISAKTVGISEDDRKVAELIVHFWSSAVNRFNKKSDSGIKVEPLAHSEPSNKGFAVFQLLVTFPADGYDVFLNVTDTMDLSGDPVKDRTVEEVAKELKAWKSMLKLMLGAAIEMAKTGTYYTLDWTDTEPTNKSRRTA